MGVYWLLRWTSDRMVGGLKPGLCRHVVLFHLSFSMQVYKKPAID